VKKTLWRSGKTLPLVSAICLLSFRVLTFSYTYLACEISFHARKVKVYLLSTEKCGLISSGQHHQFCPSFDFTHSQWMPKAPNVIM
jgi:hypothetical protein